MRGGRSRALRSRSTHDDLNPPVIIAFKGFKGSMHDILEVTNLTGPGTVPKLFRSVLPLSITAIKSYFLVTSFQGAALTSFISERFKGCSIGGNRILAGSFLGPIVRCCRLPPARGIANSPSNAVVAHLIRAGNVPFTRIKPREEIA